jgi:ABC-2 type transport system ATP-binding protein
LTIRVESDRLRELAARLLDCDFVVGLDREVDGVRARVRPPRRFFEWFGRLVVAEGFDIRRLESLDESTSDVLTYLLGGVARPGGEAS